MKVCVHCDDGTDRNCLGTVEAMLPVSFERLFEDDVSVNWVTERGKEVATSVVVTPRGPVDEWIQLNELNLTEYEVECIRSDGFFEIDYDKLEGRICGPCGSDQTYDDEGRNISSL